jgi:hypothetical protein
MPVGMGVVVRRPGAASCCAGYWTKDSVGIDAGKSKASADSQIDIAL